MVEVDVDGGLNINTKTFSDPKIQKPFGCEPKRYENILDPKVMAGSWKLDLFAFWREKISIRKTDGQGRWRKDRVDDRIQNQNENGDGEVIDNIHIDFQPTTTLAILLSPNLSPSIA